MAVPASREQLKDWCLDNKYTKWYVTIIDRALLREQNDALSSYTEKHHIIPKSIILNGDVVRLTAREHFICHLLLPKMLKNPKHIRKMKLALHRLIYGNKYEVYVKSSKTYEIVKKWHSEAASERTKIYWNTLNDTERKKFLDYRKSKRKPASMSIERRKLQSEIMKKKLSYKENHPLYKKGHSEESKRKISETKKSQGIGKKWFNNGTIELYDYQQNMPCGYVLGRITKLPVPKAATGKKWYHNPIEKVEKYFFIGHQPDGFLEGRLKNV